MVGVVWMGRWDLEALRASNGLGYNRAPPLRPSTGSHYFISRSILHDCVDQ